MSKAKATVKISQLEVDLYNTMCCWLVAEFVSFSVDKIENTILKFAHFNIIYNSPVL